jgi:putative tryptophan/tyrosine transport system substrate-binding protein
MTVTIGRRELLVALGGAAAAWPLVAWAQQGERMRRIGWMDFVPETDPATPPRVTAFREGMEKQGWVLGRNLAIDYRWSIFDMETARVVAEELLKLAPDVMFCAGSPATLALQRATRTVPVVFITVSEPLAQGIVASLSHPGGNLTGFSYLEPTVGEKWLQLLKQIAPRVNRVALMFNPSSSPYSQLFYQSIEAAAPKLAVQVSAALVHDPSEIEPVIAMLGREPRGGLIVSADAFNLANRKLIVDLAARHRVPAIYGFPALASEGGLIYYNVEFIDQYRSAAGYVDRILRGEKAGDLPVQQPTRFELRINMQTAKSLSLDVSPTLLAIADEVIE